MTPIILWLFLATPKQACVDKVKHDNLGECHEQTTSCYSIYGDYIVTNCPNGETSKTVTICDQGHDPKPLPQEKTLMSTNRYAMREDDCYEVRKTSFSMVDDGRVGISFFSASAAWISTVTFRSSYSLPIKKEKSK